MRLLQFSVLAFFLSLAPDSFAFDNIHQVSFTRDVFPAMQNACMTCHNKEWGILPVIASTPEETYWELNRNRYYINRMRAEDSMLVVHLQQQHAGGSASPQFISQLLDWIGDGALAN